jgi:hypothetical protein
VGILVITQRARTRGAARRAGRVAGPRLVMPGQWGARSVLSPVPGARDWLGRWLLQVLSHDRRGRAGVLVGEDRDEGSGRHSPGGHWIDVVALALADGLLRTIRFQVVDAEGL